MQATKEPSRKIRKAVRLPGVRQMTGDSASTTWRRVREDASFPRPFKLSPGTTVWDADEVQAWLEAKKAARGARR